MSAQCPRCGGRESRRVSPGLVECTTPYVAGVVRQPFGEQPVYQTCGHRYRDGVAPAAGAEACACGQYAIGRCVVCRQPRCGDHAVNTGQRFLCPSHLQDERAQARQSAQMEIAAAADDIEAWLRGIADPILRLMAVVAHMTWTQEPPALGAGTQWTAHEAVRESFPEWPREAVFEWFGLFGPRTADLPVERRLVVSWLRDALLASGRNAVDSHTYTYERKTFWSGARKTVQGRTVKGWRFGRGFLVADPSESDDYVGAFGVGTLMQVARLLTLPEPPTGMLDRWSRAARRVNEQQTGPWMGAEIGDAIQAGRRARAGGE